MKFITFFHNGPKGWTVLPDSTGLPTERPLFIPDRDEGTTLWPMLAVRITRLGKSISARFAHRYWDEAAPALQQLPTACLDGIMKGGLPAPDETCMDCAVVTGHWAPKEKAAFTFSPSGETLEPDENLIASAIELFSTTNTVKTGDIFLFPGSTPISVRQNDIVIATFAGTLHNTNNTETNHPPESHYRRPALLTKIK